MTETDLRAELARVTRRVDRERRARLEAEHLAEKETRALYERQRELEVLHRITDAANGATSVNEAIQVTLDEICSYTGWPVGHAYFFEDESDELVPSTIWHLDNPVLFEKFRLITEATRFKLGEGLPGSVLLSAAPIWIPDVLSAPNFPRGKVSADIGVVAAFAFPVLAGSTVTAVLEFFSSQRVEREETWLKIAAQTGIQLGRIFERQRSSADLQRASRELLDLSRSAGMAEVATGVLHNVGNVLNSVSVSATILGDRLKRSKVANLRAAAGMLHGRNGGLADFLTHDPKGKMLPNYLAKVAEQLEKEHAEMISETDCLHENIEHIKNVVAMQQNYGKVSGLAELLDPAGLAEDALRMKAAVLARHRITVKRIFAEVPRVLVDRHQVMQILINLLRNAKQALEEKPDDKTITVEVELCSPTHAAITVRDNGVGIAPENLTRIFTYGFTTKPQGHGFGLHNGANAAREMGGRLSVHSDGPGRGATFVLEVPLEKSARTASS